MSEKINYSKPVVEQLSNLESERRELLEKNAGSLALKSAENQYSKLMNRVMDPSDKYGPSEARLQAESLQGAFDAANGKKKDVISTYKSVYGTKPKVGDGEGLVENVELAHTMAIAGNYDESRAAELRTEHLDALAGEDVLGYDGRTASARLAVKDIRRNQAEANIQYSNIQSGYDALSGIKK